MSRFLLFVDAANIVLYSEDFLHYDLMMLSIFFTLVCIEFSSPSNFLQHFAHRSFQLCVFPA